MPRPSHITAITTFFIAVIFLALAALAQSVDQTVLQANGDYIPTEHCKQNPKIEGCTEDTSTGGFSTSNTKPMILAACGALFAAVFMVAFGLTITTTQQATFEERLFQLCIALMGVSLAAIFFLLST
ncbi:MAG: hypothetical protein AAGA74_16240 [Pseudomonadota bacterium]